MPIGTRATEPDYATFEDGFYTVKISGFSPVGEDGLPYLVPLDRFKTGEEILIARFNTTIDGEEGPAGTIDPQYELLPLVKAFGGDPAKLQDDEDIGRKLLKAQKMMTDSTRVLVTRNWIQNDSIEGMGVPDAFYYLRLARITSKNERGEVAPHLFTSEKGGKKRSWRSSIGRVRITRGEYKDFEIRCFVDYPLEVGEDGIPFLPLKLDNTLKISSKRFKHFLEAFYGPDYGDFPHQDCEDINNIMPLLTTMIMERNLEALGQVENNRLNLNSLGPISDEEKELLKEEPESAPPESVFTPAQEALRMVMIQEVGIHKNADAFVDGKTWDLTPKGKEWARETLVAGGEDGKSILKEYGLSRLFAEWNDSEIENVLRVLDYNKQGQKLGQDEIPF